MWNRIREWFRDRSARARLLRDFNYNARKAFIEGIVPTLLKAGVSKGCSSYRHQFSDWLKSGFRVQAFAGVELSKSDIINIGEVVLSENALVRTLVVLGFDTLEVHGDVGNYGCRWQLKDYIQLSY
ncbi:MAG: hypothetical protein LBP63_01475 [Prevotellaceae bacterium]|jgi:hypothetical protein|nr:hypothetical protein [Prevotellaceae bacterium]